MERKTIQDELICRFGPGLIGKRFLLSEIRDAKAVLWVGDSADTSWMAFQCFGAECCRD